MFVSGIVREFGELVSEAEGQVIEGIRDREIVTEPSATDRFLGALEIVTRVHAQESGILFRARTLRDRGWNAPEKKFGADFCGILNVQLGTYSQSKGVLVQAKWESPGFQVHRGRGSLITVAFSDGREMQRCQDQSEKMLMVTPDSYVMICSGDGFAVVPASSVIGLSSDGELYAKHLDRFFKEFLMCFVGDPRLRAYDPKSLEIVRKESNARFAFLLEVLKSEQMRTMKVRYPGR